MNNHTTLSSVLSGDAIGDSEQSANTYYLLQSYVNPGIDFLMFWGLKEVSFAEVSFLSITFLVTF